MDGQNEPDRLRQEIARLRALLMGIRDERATRAILDQIGETQAVLEEIERRRGRR